MRRTLLRLATPVLVAAALGACASPRPWGHEVRLSPSRSRLALAARRTLADPFTWGPAAGAALFLATGWDRPVSDWASEHTPPFGSTEGALDASDDLRDVAVWSAPATALLTPSGCSPGEILWHKAKGLAVEAGAGWLNTQATLGLKDAVGRTRPDGSDRESFPSGHTSAAASGAALSRRNLDAVPMDPRVRRAAQGAVTATAMLTGWARVEAKKHYPSDVLAGFALGNAICTFAYDAFLQPPARSRVTLTAGGGSRGVEVGLAVHW